MKSRRDRRVVEQPVGLAVELVEGAVAKVRGIEAEARATAKQLKKLEQESTVQQSAAAASESLSDVRF